MQSCIVQAPFTVFTGDHKIMPFRAAYAGTLRPFDLTDCTEINVALPKADGSFSHRLLTLGQVVITDAPALGYFEVDIPSSVSPGLNIGELQNVDVTFTIAGAPQTVRFYESLSVFERDP